MTEKCRKFQQIDVQKQPRLIAGLPDEIAIECLVRVPHRFHSTMKLVCHGWKNLISHPSFYSERRRLGAAENLIALVQALPTFPPSSSTATDMAVDVEKHDDHPMGTIQLEDEKGQMRRIQQGPPLYGLSIYNVKHQSWHRLVMNQKNHDIQIGAVTPASTEDGISIPMFCHCVSLPSHGKLLLLGGWDPSTLEPVPDLYIIDFISGSWKKGSPMSTPRSFFACAVVGSSSVYVAGGHDSQKNALKSAEMYDVVADEWRMLPSMLEERDECQGLSWEDDSRFWVVSGYGTESQGRFRNDAEFYDPDSGSWSKVNGVWPFVNSSPRSTVATTSIATDISMRQWRWLYAGSETVNGPMNQDRQQDRGRAGELRQFDWEEKRWKVVSSIQLPNGLSGSSLNAADLGVGNRMFVMGNGGEKAERRSSDERESETNVCGYGNENEGAFLLGYHGGGKDVIVRNGSATSTHKWMHIHTPAGFLGLPYSASHLLI